MGLVKCADAFIGNPSVKKGISGGEMKRLAFACEILSNPPVLFCDEPTSGLDSFMAQNVVETLKYMASKGHTVLCTIHQPASPVFQLFDRVLLMAEGRVAFMGSSSNALDFFSSCNSPCPLNYNPADHYVHTLAIMPGNEVKCKQRVKKICDKFSASEYGKDLDRLIKLAEKTEMDEFDTSQEEKLHKSPYKTSWWRQFQFVLWRCWITNFRNSAVTATRFLQNIALGLVFGLLYMGQHTDQTGIVNINGALFLIQTQLTYGPIFSTIMTFPPEFPIYIREHHKGVYQCSVYFLSKTLAEIPVFIILPTIVCTLVYWFTGMNPSAWSFFVALVTSILVCTTSVSFGYMLSSSSSKLEKVLAVAPVFINPIVYIGGMYIDTSSIPVYFYWLKYISWITYSNEILVTNQWSTVDYISCEAAHGSINNSTCLRTGQEVIDNLGMKTEYTRFNMTMLAVLTIVYRLISFLLLYIRSRKKN